MSRQRRHPFPGSSAPARSPRPRARTTATRRRRRACCRRRMAGNRPPASAAIPWTWPLIALVALLLLVLVGTVIALLASPGKPTPDQQRDDVRTRRLRPRRRRRRLISFDPKVLAGMNKTQAQAELTKLGLGTMTATTGDRRPDARAGRNRRGLRRHPDSGPRAGSVVTVEFYGAASSRRPRRQRRPPRVRRPTRRAQP